MYTLNSTGLVSTKNGGIGVGTTSPSAGVHVVRTTEQLRLAYDTTNYVTLAVSSAGNLTITPSGASINIPKLNSSVVVAPTTAATPATAAATGTVFTNEGDADGVTITLPSAAAGLTFTFYVDVAQIITITAATGDTIRIASDVTATAGSITSNVIGSSVTLVAINATKWVATSSVGSWSI